MHTASTNMYLACHQFQSVFQKVRRGLFTDSEQGEGLKICRGEPKLKPWITQYSQGHSALQFSLLRCKIKRNRSLPSPFSCHASKFHLMYLIGVAVITFSNDKHRPSEENIKTRTVLLDLRRWRSEFRALWM
jgi:hypothetical protein